MKSLVKIRKIAQQLMTGLDPAHDFSHVERVEKLSMKIARKEKGVNIEILEIAVLLHDIARQEEDLAKNLKVDHAILGVARASQILAKLNYPPGKIDKINHCIASHRLRGKIKPQTLEAKIISDADKLDILGAIGIGRSFMLADKFKQQPFVGQSLNIHNYIKTNLVEGKSEGRIINHSLHTPQVEFETKLKFIPNKLYTKTAKKIARQRLKFMKEFFLRLDKEINGKL